MRRASRLRYLFWGFTILVHTMNRRARPVSALIVASQSHCRRPSEKPARDIRAAVPPWSPSNFPVRKNWEVTIEIKRFDPQRIRIHFVKLKALSSCETFKASSLTDRTVSAEPGPPAALHAAFQLDSRALDVHVVVHGVTSRAES